MSCLRCWRWIGAVEGGGIKKLFCEVFGGRVTVFLGCVLVPDPQHRYTARTALEHLMAEDVPPTTAQVEVVSAPGEMLDLKVIDIHGRSHSIQISNTQTGAELHAAITAKIGYPVNLIHHGQPIEDNTQTLASLGIEAYQGIGETMYAKKSDEVDSDEADSIWD